MGSSDAIDVLSRLGALVLMFEVGLECTMRGVLAVGGAALRVAVLGTVGSLALGYVTATLLMPGAPVEVRAFIGAAITATSVGITARVLKDMGQTASIEARTILGAAVLDDILALIVLALASGWIAHRAVGGGASLAPLLWISTKTVAFL